MFIYNKYKSFLNTFKYGTQLVSAFGLQPIRHEYAIFSFEFVKVCLHRLRHDLSTHVESARHRNMKSRLAIKLPTPYEWWSNALPPGREKVSNPRGMLGGDVEVSIWLVHNWWDPHVRSKPWCCLNQAEQRHRHHAKQSTDLRPNSYIELI